LLVKVGSAGAVSATDTVSAIVVPDATPVPTVTVKLKAAVAPDANVVAALFVHFNVPTVQVQPAGPVSVNAVVPAGRVSVTVIDAAVAVPATAGPRFFTVCV
jgi:hypothetical protein